MKSLVFIFAISICSMSVASDAITTRDHSCDSLNISLEDQGYLKVRDGFFNLSTFFVYSRDYVESEMFLGCDFDENLSRARVRSKDSRRCKLGYECVRDFDSLNQVISAGAPQLPF